MADLVICHCKQCQNTIGTFINLWYEIGMDMISIVESNDLEVCQKRRTVTGEPGTLMENCQLQIIACVSCSAFLGLKCVETPVNHVLDRNQIMFYHGSVVPFNDAGKEVPICIARVLDYREPSRVSTVNSAETQGEYGNPRWRLPKVIDTSPLENELASQRQVESLQMEFEILKGRVERLEADRQITERQEPTRLFGAGDLSPNINMSSTYRKRTSSEAGLPEIDIVRELPSTPAIDISPCLARSRGTRRRTAGMRPESSA